jgi:hypothetical protein
MTLPFVAPVVATVMVTAEAAPALTLTEELLKLQVGARFVVGEMLQVRLTVPVKEPAGVRARLNWALWPALTVCDGDEPDAEPRVKPAATVATPDRATVCGLPEALSEREIVPVRFPAVDGLNVAEIWQLPPAGSDTPHVLVSAKFEDATSPASWRLSSIGESDHLCSAGCTYHLRAKGKKIGRERNRRSQPCSNQCSRLWTARGAVADRKTGYRRTRGLGPIPCGGWRLRCKCNVHAAGPNRQTRPTGVGLGEVSAGRDAAEAEHNVAGIAQCDGLRKAGGADTLRSEVQRSG